jgi:hypothetical protein
LSWLRGGARLSNINAKALADLETNPVEDFWPMGARNEHMHGFPLKPLF